MDIETWNNLQILITHKNTLKQLYIIGKFTQYEYDVEYLACQKKIEKIVKQYILIQTYYAKLECNKAKISLDKIAYL